MRRKFSIVLVFLLLINLIFVLPVFAWGNNLVTLDKSSLSLKVGDVGTLTATISPANDNSLQWSSVDVDGSNVIQLDKTKGNPVKVTAQNVGVAVVTVRHGNRTASCKVTVGPSLPPSSGNTGLSVDVNADQVEITKPLDGPATDNLNITLTPTGSVSTAIRPPVDIVFVFDKSGSMEYEVGDSGLSKLDLAKNALDGAVDFFSNTNNANTNDRLALVAFDSGVYCKNSLMTKAKNGFINLKNTVNSLDAKGGTNYTAALNEAINTFKSSPSDLSRKYVIFLTDGMPTISMKNEQVNQVLKDGYFNDKGNFQDEGSKTFTLQTNVNYDSNYDPYPNKYIVDNNHLYYFPNMTFQSIENSIMDQGKEKATELAQMNIKLYSIGLGDLLPNNDMSSWSDKDAVNYMANYLNFDYLQELSEGTGGTALQALPYDTNSLNNVFQSLIQQINNQTMSEIQFRVKLPDNVSLSSDSNAHMEDGYAVLNMSDITYLAGGTTPNPTNELLQLLFSETGVYKFDDMKLSYKDLNGVQQTVNINPVTINVNSAAIPVTDVLINPTSLQLKPEQKAPLTATVNPSNATNQTITWSSSNPNVATVDSNGLVTAKQVGSAEITASADGKTSPPCDVNVALGNDATLTILSISNGTLSPPFASDTTDYSVIVPYDAESEIITATVSDLAASLKINGNDATSGVASSPISLHVGDNVIPILVTAQDGKTTKVYTVTITRQDYPAPEFSLSKNGIVGNVAIVDIKSVPSTILDNTEWLKYDNASGAWVNFHTGPFASNGEGVTDITLNANVDRGNNIIVNPQEVKIRAVTAEKTTERSLDFVTTTINNPFTITGQNESNSSGNRATKVKIVYNLSVPKGFEVVQGLDEGGVPIFNSTYKIVDESGNDVMNGTLPPDGINHNSTSVVKFLKSSNGYSQKFLVQGKLDFILRSTTTGAKFRFSIYSDPVGTDAFIKSNENLQ
jgi:uncharacterized protein YjdB